MAKRKKTRVGREPPERSTAAPAATVERYKPQREVIEIHTTRERKRNASGEALSGNMLLPMTNETTKNEKPIPSLAELLTINHDQDTICDLLAIAKMQARTIERLTTPAPSLPTIVAEWMPMVSALMELFARRQSEPKAHDAQRPLHVVDATVDTIAEHAA